MEKRSKKWMFISIIGVALLIIGGFQMLLFKTGEERRNREYEISLVKALKNSYAGIEEIKITNPNYTSPPGSWSCDVEITFSDKEKIKYRIGHSLDETKNYHGSVQGESNEEINEQWQISNSHKGKTTSLVIVIYSDREKEQQ